MAGGRKGLVAPQNTFLENIVRRSNGKCQVTHNLCLKVMVFFSPKNKKKSNFVLGLKMSILQCAFVGSLPFELITGTPVDSYY